MKKIIFLLLLAQTIAFITADSGCMKYSWGMGEKAPEHTQCYCPCERYSHSLNNRYKCSECGHYRIPKKMDFAIKNIAAQNIENNEISLHENLNPIEDILPM